MHVNGTAVSENTRVDLGVPGSSTTSYTLKARRRARHRLADMPKFVIEREIPGAGKATEEEIRAGALKSLEALRAIGPQIQWLHSYVTDNKVYCVYLAPDEATILEHARAAGIPANRVSAVRRLMDATAAE
jgi:hypothetical protein